MKKTTLITSYDDKNKKYYDCTFTLYEIDDINNDIIHNLFVRQKWFNDEIVENIRKIDIPWQENRLSDDSVVNYDYYVIDCDKFTYFVGFPHYYNVLFFNHGSSLDICINVPFTESEWFSIVKSDYDECDFYSTMGIIFDALNTKYGVIPPVINREIVSYLDRYFDYK